MTVDAFSAINGRTRNPVSTIEEWTPPVPADLAQSRNHPAKKTSIILMHFTNSTNIVCHAAKRCGGTRKLSTERTVQIHLIGEKCSASANKKLSSCRRVQIAGQKIIYLDQRDSSEVAVYLHDHWYNDAQSATKIGTLLDQRPSLSVESVRD